MEKHAIDTQTYPRKAHFDYFRTLAYPYAGLTVEVDITRFLQACRENGWPFFHAFLHCVAGAANAVPALRQRVVGQGVVEYDVCEVSYTVAKPDGTFCFCRLDANRPLRAFLPYAAERQALALRADSIEDDADAEGLLFVSCVPWVHYTAMTQPVPSPADSNPRLTWGKYTETAGRVTLPMSILVNHALVDGRQMADFYAELEKQLAAAAEG